MTIASTTNRNEYPGAGSAGPFTFNFRIFAASDLRVIRRSSAGVETVLAYPADYTVPATAIGTATGTLTLTAVLAAGETLVIRRVLPLTQATDLANQGTYFPKNIEDQFDRQIAIDQQLQAQIDRSLQLDESYDPASYDFRIPPGSAGQAIGWNSTGTGLANLSAATPSVSAYLTGAGSPEGAITAGVGTLYAQTDGANGKTLWRKKSGVGNTGWGLMASHVGTFNVVDYGATIGADSTTAFQAAAAAACASVDNGDYYGAVVEIPPGAFVLKARVDITVPRVHVQGAGKYATAIIFTNATAATCFKFQMANPALTISQNSIGGMAFIGGNTTQQKVAIDAYDFSEFHVYDIITNEWKGNSGNAATPSIALRTQGREFLYVDELTGYADRPIHIKVNPNLAQAGDHFSLRRCYLGAYVDAEDCIVVDNPGVVNDLFIDEHSWVGGRHGINWDCPGATASIGTQIKNVRREQTAAASAATGYAVRIIGGGHKQVILDNVQSDSGANGFYLRMHTTSGELTYVNTRHEGGAGTTAYDHQAGSIVALNAYANQNSTVTDNGMEERFALNRGAFEGLPVSRVRYLGAASETTKRPNFAQGLSALDAVFSGLVDLSAAAAGQVKFPAAQNASADANTMDDYEEGTFTPALACGTSGTITPTTALGSYTKEGDTVKFALYLSINSVAAPVGTLTVTGLPFTVKAGLAHLAAPGVFVSKMAGTFVPPVMGLCEVGTATLSVWTRCSVAGGASSSNAADIQATTEIAISGSYKV